MLRYRPYSELTDDDKQAYEFMLLREQFGFKYSQIAKDYHTSPDRVMRLHRRAKCEQIQLYINHIALMLEHKDKSQIEKEFQEIYKCYRSLSYSCAYLENKYSDILSAYRFNEPRMPKEFIESIPPFRPRLTSDTFNRLIEMRDNEHASYTAIANELNITPQKARYTYEAYYHHRTLKILKSLEGTFNDRQSKIALWDYCFNNNFSDKKRYEMMLQKQIQLKTDKRE